MKHIHQGRHVTMGSGDATSSNLVSRHLNGYRRYSSALTMLQMLTMDIYKHETIPHYTALNSLLADFLNMSLHSGRATGLRILLGQALRQCVFLFAPAPKQSCLSIPSPNLFEVYYRCKSVPAASLALVVNKRNATPAPAERQKKFPISA